MDQPLPNYSDRQINRKREVTLNGPTASNAENQPQDSVLSDHLDNLSIPDKIPIKRIRKSSKKHNEESQKSFKSHQKAKNQNSDTRDKTPAPADKVDKNLYNFFGEGNKKQKRADSGERKDSKRIKFMDSDNSGSSHYSSQSNFLKSKPPQKTKLSDFFNPLPNSHPSKKDTDIYTLSMKKISEE